jgi:hypothetical protein
MWLLGGGAINKVSESSSGNYFKNTSSPTGADTGVYLSGNNLFIKPATSTTYYRIWVLRTRTSQ